MKNKKISEILNCLKGKIGCSDGSCFIDAAQFGTAFEQYYSHFYKNVEEDPVKGLVQWLDDSRAKNHIFAKREGLNTLSEWRLDENGFLSHIQSRFFRVIGLKAISHRREIAAWSQPILDNEGSGIIGLLIRKTSGSTQFLMQAKADVGNSNIVQIGPTVQFNPGNYIDNDRIRKPFLFDEFVHPGKYVVLKESRQSEEGGRFYQEDHIHRILVLPDNDDLHLPENFRWFSYSQLRFFLHMGNIVNSAARSILACCL